MHPYPRAVGSALEQGEAVAHLGSAGRGQQALAKQTELLGDGRIGEVFEVLADLALQVRLQGAGGRQVEAVKVVERPGQGQRQTAAGDTDALVGDNWLNGGLCYPVAVDRFAGQCCFGKWPVNDIAGSQNTDMAVGEFSQFVAPFGQKVRRAALGNHQ
ncbi:hypothetical protein D3C78_1001270 [compost metagenome]